MSQSEVPPSTQGSKPAIQLLAILTLCYLVSFAGTEGALKGLGDWYESIHKPSWAVPNWFFSPAWTLLYGSMGVAIWQVVRSTESPVRTRAIATSLFVFQIALSGVWPWVFFGAQKFAVSTFEVSVLWLLVALTTWAFFRVRSLAGALMIPYLFWVSFSACLNFSIYSLNK